MAKKRKAKSEELDFEDALSEVEQIVEDLEGGHLGLGESLDKYELGIRRLKRCHELINLAERKVELLSSLDEDGTPITQPFAAEGDITDAEGRSQRQSDKRSTSNRDNVDEFPGLF